MAKQVALAGFRAFEPASFIGGVSQSSVRMASRLKTIFDNIQTNPIRERLMSRFFYVVSVYDTDCNDTPDRQTSLASDAEHDCRGSSYPTAERRQDVRMTQGPDSRFAQYDLSELWVLSRLNWSTTTVG